MPKTQSAVLLCALVVATAAALAVSQEACRPTLSSKASAHSEVVIFQRRWTGVFAADASRCSTTSGAFEIEFVRLKDVGPDLSFKEQFAWMAGETKVNLDLTWDDWINSYRISDVAPCPCRR